VARNVGKHLLKCIKSHFPDLCEHIKLKIEDVRDPRGKKYGIDEAILSVLLMFLLKEGSRNSYNQDRDDGNFKRNIKNLVGINLMHGDAFNDVLTNVNPEDLQKLKATLVNNLIKRKIFKPDPITNKYIVAIDATGTHCFDENYCEKCLEKTSKNEVTSYSHAVLEAKLVSSDGFCISLASEWLENEGNYDKQDCETNAFKRLAVKIEELYGSLPILLLGDGLYATQPVIEIATKNKWSYMLVLKDGRQKCLSEEIMLRPDKKQQRIGHSKAMYLCDLELGKYKVNYLQWEEISNKFCWITDLEITGFLAVERLQKIGRTRWVIENEGFNTQKNLGYKLEHKYSRISYTALQNYYQCLQIAHMIEQLTLIGEKLKGLFGKITIIKMSERLRNLLVLTLLEINSVSETKFV